MTLESICLPTVSVCRKKPVSNAQLAKRLDALERIVFEAIEGLLNARAPERNEIGFRAKQRKKRKTRAKA